MVEKNRIGGKPKSSGFNFKPPDDDDVKQRAERRSGGSFDNIFKAGVDVWRPKDGDKLIRILPAGWENEKNHYALKVFIHKWVGVNKGTYLCLRRMRNKTCPICEASEESSRAGEREDAYKLSALEHYVCYILARDDDKMSNIPQLYLMGRTLDSDIAALSRSKKSGKTLWLTNQDEGNDVNVRRTGKQLLTKYLPSIEHESCPILDDQKAQDKVIAHIIEYPIPSLLEYKSAEYLEQIMSGTVEEKDPDLDNDDVTADSAGDDAIDDDAGDDDPLPRTRGPRRDMEEAEETIKPRRSREHATAHKIPAKPDDDADPDEGADDDSDDEEEEDTKPISRHRGSNLPETDDEDPDDDPPPRSRGVARRK